MSGLPQVRHRRPVKTWLTGLRAGPYIPADFLIPVVPTRPATRFTMSNSDSPPPTSPPPSGSKSPDSPKRPEKSPSSGNVFWYLMLGFVFAALAYSWSTRPRTPTTISFSEFLDGLKGDDPKYSKLNVHELVIDRGYVTFQTEPNGPDNEPPKTAKHFQVPIEKLFEADQSRLLTLLEEKEIRHGYTKPISPWPELIFYTAFLVLFLVFFLFMLRRIGGPGAAMSFSPRRGQLFAQEDVQVTFADVARIDEAVE